MAELYSILLLEYTMKVSQLLQQPPKTWGLRGDPYLWKDMQKLLSHHELPNSVNQLKKLLEESFEQLAKHSINHTKPIFIKSYQHGGMSSGYVSPPFWRDQAIPLILERFNQLFQT